MAITDSVTSFSPSKFVEDFKRTSDAISAPYSEPAILAVLKVFEGYFKEGIIILRATNRPGDPVNYRFFIRRPLDTIRIATEGGLIEPDSPMARLITSWSSLFNGESWQWCDFDPRIGFSKSWINFKGPKPIDAILNAPDVPAPIRAHGPKFHSLGLDKVVFGAGDYHGNTVNIYFFPSGPISKTQAAQFTGLVDCAPPTEEEFEELHTYLRREGFTFGLTMEFKTGKITRIAFYALPMTDDKSPKLDDQIVKFLSAAPSYDKERTRIIAWSYGLGNSKYVKAESSYTGEWADLLKAAATARPS